MQLYLEGHSARHGYAVSVGHADHEIPSMPIVAGDEQILPVRFYQNRRHADRVIARFNRRFGTKYKCTLAEVRRFYP